LPVEKQGRLREWQGGVGWDGEGAGQRVTCRQTHHKLQTSVVLEAASRNKQPKLEPHANASASISQVHWKKYLYIER